MEFTTEEFVAAVTLFSETSALDSEVSLSSIFLTDKFILSPGFSSDFPLIAKEILSKGILFPFLTDRIVVPFLTFEGRLKIIFSKLSGIISRTVKPATFIFKKFPVLE